MGDGEFWYPAVEDVVAVHADIVEEYPDTEPGIRDRGGVGAAVDRARRAGNRHGDVHRAAAKLLRLLTANHPFVDANKRTALGITATFYRLNGYEFDYDHDVRRLLVDIATDESEVDESAVPEYLRTNTNPAELDALVEEWREPLLRRGVEELLRRREESADGPTDGDG